MAPVLIGYYENCEASAIHDHFLSENYGGWDPNCAKNRHERGVLMPYADKMRELKNKHGVTYAQWSEMSNVPEGTIKSICAGTTENASFAIMCDLITSLNESIDEFYHGHPAALGSEEIKKDAGPNDQHHYHHFHIMSMRGDMREMAKEAIANAHTTEAYKSAQNDIKWWRFIALAELAFISGVLLFDLTHPDMGYIQYMASILPSVTGFVDRLRMII